MWTRKPGELDLANGDLGEFVDDGSIRPRFKPFFSGLILRAPTPESNAAESVKPRSEKPSKNSIRVKSNVDAERECEVWLAGEMAKSPDFRPKPKQEWFNEAQGRWPGKISRMRFNIIWSDRIRATGAHKWGHSGAPKRTAPNNQSPK
jgi:hypothetical protein